MVIEGVKLMMLGMGVVFIFLLILYVVIELSSLIFKGYTEKEIVFESRRRASLAPQFKKSPSEVHDDDAVLTAVISAAISRYRSDS